MTNESPEVPAVCPNCGKDLGEIPRDMRVVCPACRADIDVPTTDEAAGELIPDFEYYHGSYDFPPRDHDHDVYLLVKTKPSGGKVYGFDAETWADMEGDIDTVDSTYGCLGCPTICLADGPLPNSFCPMCGTEMAEVSVVRVSSWQDLSRTLQEHGVPESRANVVAVAARNPEFADGDIASLLRTNTQTVRDHIESYRTVERPNTDWLVDHGPQV